ncbi:proline/glycine betaine ABC transporter ATP-binding protein, partial [Clostridioides difficile]|nr:proline/glycine betaine ABC transporter ATP-binding protein [Clostridioides difficile]NJB05767.1 proline/glycine betaine ABC transporter ATP-binding protein [Clostridioides difficile]
SALDPITRTSLQEQLFSLQDELKKTIIFVTHDMDEALKIADKICIMKDGRIAQYDTPENILRKPANDFVKDFIGEDRVWDNPEYIKA